MPQDHQPAQRRPHEIKAHRDDFFLPDLSSGPVVFMLTLLFEILVLAQHLSLPADYPFNWYTLTINSLFVQWHVVTCCLFIYLSRSWLSRFSALTASTIVLIGITGITLTLSLLPGLISTPTHIEWQPAWHNALVALMITGVLLRYFFVQHQLRVQQQVVHNARLDSLQARIRPHFLFNSMNIIASLIRINPEKAEQAVEDLSDLFRSSLQEQDLSIPIRQEIALSKSYLRIEQHRLGDRLQTLWHTAALPESVTIPPFTLQPLVENAVYHGIQPLEQGGLIEIAISISDNRVQILVKNPMSLTGSISKGNRIALENIQSRLTILYGAEASLTTRIEEAGDARQFIARITYPFQGKSYQ